MSATTRDAATIVEVVVEPKTGRFTLQREDGAAIESGTWAVKGGTCVLRVPLTYDASVYFDTLVDRQRAADRADRLRTALEAAEDALDAASKGGPLASARLAAELARKALEAPFELAVKRETEERRAEERRRRGAEEEA